MGSREDAMSHNHPTLAGLFFNACQRELAVGVARFIDASIYRDTFPAIRIAILFFTIAIFFDFLLNFIF